MYGYKVSICRNGKEAVTFYENNWKIIDMVLLDLNMPVMNGYEAFIEMKKINPEIRVLLSSGYSLNDEAQHIIDKGAMGFLQKPYRSEKLSQKISDILKKQFKL